MHSVGNYAFYDCGSLEAFDLDGVVSIGDGAFYGCRSWKSLKLPQSLNTIGSQAFCLIGITELVIPEWIKEANVGEDAFASDKLIRLVYPQSWTGLKGFHSRSNTTLEEISLPGKCVEIPKSAFFNFLKLKTVKGGKNLLRIGSNAFAGCESLESFDHESLFDEIGSGSFYKCKSLKNINIGYNVTRIPDSAFAFCEALEYIDTSGLSYIEYVGYQAFYRSGLTDCAFLSYERPSVIGCEAFRDCKNMVGDYIDFVFGTVDADEDNRYVAIPATVEKIGADAFYGCTSLKGIILEGESDVATLLIEKHPRNGSQRSPFFGCPVERLIMYRDIDHEQECFINPLPVLDNVTYLRLGRAYTWNSHEFNCFRLSKDGAITFQNLKGSTLADA